MVKTELAGPLTKISNTSLETGEVPQKWKIAKVRPLFKSGDKKDINNYRPISLLPVFSKILEKAVKRQIVGFLENNILCKEQFGFRAKMETQHAVMNFCKNLEEGATSKHQTAIFVDIRKAFDTVNHNILLEKLKNIGIRGKAWEWFRSYLTGRKQSVVLEEIRSAEMLITAGVPQGSVLGPLLFLIYINDMPNSTKLPSSLLRMIPPCRTITTIWRSWKEKLMKNLRKCQTGLLPTNWHFTPKRPDIYSSQATPS